MGKVPFICFGKIFCTFLPSKNRTVVQDRTVRTVIEVPFNFIHSISHLSTVPLLSMYSFIHTYMSAFYSIHLLHRRWKRSGGRQMVPNGSVNSMEDTRCVGHAHRQGPCEVTYNESVSNRIWCGNSLYSSVLGLCPFHSRKQPCRSRTPGHVWSHASRVTYYESNSNRIWYHMAWQSFVLQCPRSVPIPML